MKSADGTHQAHGLELHIEHKRKRHLSVRTSESELNLSTLLAHHLFYRLVTIDLLCLQVS